MAKCDFNKPEVKFLDHVVGRDGIKVDPAKIAVIQEWPLPTSTTELRQCLGLANYFRKFIQGYSSLAAPLTALTLISNDKVRLSLNNNNNKRPLTPKSIPPTTADEQTQAQKRRGSRSRKLLGAKAKSYRLKN